MAFAIVFIIIVNILFITGYQQQPPHDGQPHNYDNPAMTASISSDGKYIVTNQLNQQLTLWNIARKTTRLISHDANIYSARFIPNTDYFLWQNVKSNEVYVMSVTGEIIKQFNPGFPVYNHIMTNDLNNYFASTKNWHLIWRHNNLQRTIAKKYNNSDFYCGKTIGFSIYHNLLLTTGDTLAWKKIGVGVWNIKTGKLLHNLVGDKVLTYGTFSPDGKYTVTGDDNGLGFIWNSRTGKKILSLDIPDYKSKTKGAKPPANFYGRYHEPPVTVIALKFIDHNHYIRFNQGSHYLTLYHTDNPQPIKYIKIANMPYLALYDSTEDTIDTSYKAHIIVIGHSIKSGLSIYRYYQQTKTIRLIWCHELPRHQPPDDIFTKIQKFIIGI